jgi:hypothetical protein
MSMLRSVLRSLEFGYHKQETTALTSRKYKEKVEVQQHKCRLMNRGNVRLTNSKVCVCVCVYVCMCVYVFMYVCMYVCMYACMHACMYVCMYVWVYVCICVAQFLSHIRITPHFDMLSFGLYRTANFGRLSLPIFFRGWGRRRLPDTEDVCEDIE